MVAFSWERVLRREQNQVPQGVDGEDGDGL